MSNRMKKENFVEFVVISYMGAFKQMSMNHTMKTVLSIFDLHTILNFRKVNTYLNVLRRKKHAVVLKKNKLISWPLNSFNRILNFKNMSNISIF